MKTGVFGGTFNPPHSGHVNAANACVRELALDRLIIVPTSLPPHKELPEFSASAEQRLFMAGLMSKLVPGSEVSDIEILRGGRSYTFETLEIISAEDPGDELYFIVGTDMLETLPEWRRPERICELASIAAVARENDDRERIERAAERLRKDFGAKVFIINAEPVVTSSTEARGGSLENVPRSIREYIKNECLYVDMKGLEKAVRERLSERRFRHTLGVAALSRELARIYGEGENRACCAALLHDATKELSEDGQRALCEKYGLKVDYGPEDFKKLIHADTAAAEAEHVFGMCPDVCRAIRSHTVGNDSMTLLDKIVYVADACEENRSWDGSDRLRELSKRDLDAAAVFLMEETIKILEKSGKKPYYKTQTALAALKNAKGKEEERMSETSSQAIMETAVAAADAKKAGDITVLKVSAQTTLTDYFVIMTGMSSTHLRALSEEIEKKLGEAGVTPHHIEGVTTSWILMDYKGAVINIFLQDAREMYALERLWGDAEKIDISNLIAGEKK